MKTTQILVSILCCMIWLAGYSAESEPNGTKAQANNLGLNGNNSGAIDPSTDVDFWKVTTNSDGKLDVTLTISNGVYGYVQLYDNNATTLLVSNFTAGTITISNDGLAAGIYFIKVFSYNSSDVNDKPTYTISNVLTTAPVANDAEPNGTSATAVTLALGGSANGHSGYYYNLVRDSTDWYKIITTGNGQLSITITSQNGHYVYAQLFDGNATTYLNGNYTAGSITYNTDGLAAGTYYVKVFCFYNYDFAPYTLSNSFTAPPVANDVEPNNTKGQAKVVNLNNKKTGQVGYYYNGVRDTTDWFKFTTTGDGLVKLKFTSENGHYIYWQLYDNNGTTYLNGSYTAGTGSYNTAGLAAGTYYIKIFAFYSYDFGSYTITDSLFAAPVANDVEPNGTPATAQAFPLNSTVTGHANYYYNLKRDTADWWVINATVDGMISLSLTVNDGSYTYWTLYDNDGTTVLNSVYTTGTNNYTTDGLAAGTYYVRVYTFYNTDFSAYTLTNTLTPYTNANDGFSNDFAKRGATVPANGTVQGHVGFRIDGGGGARDPIDWWKINYTGTGNLTVTLNFEIPFNGPTAYTYLNIYKDTALSPIFSAYNATGTVTTNLTSLTQGYYYVAVVMYYPLTSWTAYNLTSTFTQTNCVTSVSATTTHAGANCTNSYITFKATGGINQYLQLYRYGAAQGNKVPVDGTGSYKFENLSPGNYYAVGASDGATGACQATSPTATVVPKPKNLTATNVTSTAADVNWTVLTCAKYYFVQYRILGDTKWKKKTTSGNVGTYHLTGLTASTTYEYRVAANDSLNGQTANGKYSAISSFGTLARIEAPETSTQQNLSVYPNPASSNVNVSFENGTEGEVTMRLFDVTGKIVLVRTEKASSGTINEKLDLTDLNTGVYQLQVITADGNVLNQSIVKTKE